MCYIICMSEFRDAIDRHLDRIHDPELEEQQLQDIIGGCQELLERVDARTLLEEVNEFWEGVGKIQPTLHGLSLVYVYTSASRFSPTPLEYINHRFTDNKEYKHDAVAGFEIRPYLHQQFDRFDEVLCLRVGRITTINDFDIEYQKIFGWMLKVCPFDLKTLIFNRDFFNRDSSYVTKRYDPDCVYPGSNAREQLRERLIALSADDLKNALLPSQREEAAQAVISKVEELGLLYPSREALLEAAKAEADADLGLRQSTPPALTLGQRIRVALRGDS